MSTPRHVPPLGYSWLTRIYDPFQRATLGGDRVQRRILELIELEQEGKTLELGCGTGVLTNLLAKQAGSGDVVALDPDVPALHKVMSKGLDPCRLVRGSAAAVPFPTHCFDRVVSSLAFHHLTPGQKQQALREARRVLRPGGRLGIADFGKASNLAMRLAFVPVQLLDGFATTADSVEGKLPAYARSAGFTDVEVADRWSTLFGTLEFVVARA